MGAFDEHIGQYDANGNIKKLDRYFNGVLADNLTYTHELNDKSNRLQRVADPAGDAPGVADYALQNGLPYAYDANGNMTTDPGKGTAISYNHLNLPQTVTFATGEKLFYRYDSSGRKLAQTLETPASGRDKYTEYVGGTVYVDGQPVTVGTPEGRLVPDGSGNWRHEYFLKDHLGNTRAVVAGTLLPGTADVLQTTAYYPFGLAMAQTDYNTLLPNYHENRYLYNGKELQTEGSESVELGWYDYGARMYDAALGRWHVIDRMAEDYEEFSSYNYCLNNPISNVDPDGMDVIDMGDRIVINGDDVVHYMAMLKMVNSGQGSRSNMMEAITSAAKAPGEGSGHMEGALLAEDTPSRNPSVSSNNETGYIYNKDDLRVRNSVMKTDNPIATYIKSQESTGNYDVLNAYDFWMKYGHTLGNLMLMDTYIPAGAGLGASAQSFGSQPTPRGPQCFVGNTQISTNIGLKSISEIQLGDSVWTYNFHKNILELNKVFATKASYAEKLIKLIVNAN